MHAAKKCGFEQMSVAAHTSALKNGPATFWKSSISFLEHSHYDNHKYNKIECYFDFFFFLITHSLFIHVKKTLEFNDFNDY